MKEKVKRRLTEYLFRDIGILFGGIFIGKSIAGILVNYNTCLIQEYIDLIEEFEIMETRESIFAKMCDKLELDDIRIKKLISEGAKSIADLFIENDRPIYKDDAFIEILEYIKKNKISNLKKYRKQQVLKMSPVVYFYSNISSKKYIFLIYLGCV